MTRVRRALAIFVGFVHDFAAGCWAASVLAVFWLDRSGVGGEGGAVLAGLEKRFFFAGLACTAVVLLAGVGRTFTYATAGAVYGEESEGLRRRMLAIKHVVLLAVFGLGTWWQYAMAWSPP